MELIENEKEKFFQLLKDNNDKKLKKWYKLKDIVGLKNISYKSLKNMIKPIYQKHSKTGLIYKKGRRYYISYKLLDEFCLKQPRNGNKETWYSMDWLANISYTTKDHYDKAYHTEIIRQIKNTTITVNYLSAIEEDKSGRLHVHMLADWHPEILKPAIDKILNFYLEGDYNLYCEPIQLKGACVDYLIKNPQKLIY
jgi:hypothetical protein